MDGVGPRLGYFGDDAPGASSIFGGEVASEHFEFLDRVWIRVINDAISEQIVIQSAVQDESVGIAASTSDAEGQSSAKIPLAVTGIVGREDARLKGHQIESVA